MQLLEHGALEVVEAFAGDGGNLHQLEVVLLRPALEFLDLLLIGGVHFGGDDDLGFVWKIGIVFREFGMDRVEFLDRIAFIHDRDVNQMKQHPRAFDVPEELNAEAMSKMRPFDQPRNIGDDERLVAAIYRNHAELRFERRERIVRNLRPGCGNAGDQCGLAHVRVAHQAGVGQEFELQPQRFFFAESAILRFMRHAVRSGLEEGIAMASASALSDQDPLVGLGKIVEQFAGGVVVDLGAGRDRNIEILAVTPVTVAAFAVPSAFGAEDMVESEFEKRVLVGIRDEIDVAAVTAIAAAGTALRDELLPPEGNATVPAVTGFDCNFGFVDERGLFDRLNRDESARGALILELNDAADLGEQRVVLADADVDTGLEFRAALPDEDRPARHQLAAKALHSEPLGVAIPSVA